MVLNVVEIIRLGSLKQRISECVSLTGFGLWKTTSGLVWGLAAMWSSLATRGQDLMWPPKKVSDRDYHCS